MNHRERKMALRKKPANVPYNRVRRQVLNHPEGGVEDRIPEPKCGLCGSQPWRVPEGSCCVCRLEHAPEVIERPSLLKSSAGTCRSEGRLHGCDARLPQQGKHRVYKERKTA